MVQSSLEEADIFQIARDIGTPQTRVAYLQQACGNDDAMLARVVALLKIAEEEQSFLERPPEIFAPTLASLQVTESPGTFIGPFKLLEQIGEGGFGVVFVAEQSQPVRRKVALKILKPGMDTRQVIARFEAERQALALMDHPHIAKVLDAGATESGRPYFVMELVKGIPITDYCEQSQLGVRERLDLLVDVCHAVQHAHQKGIIHRDLKPSNILVTEIDGKPIAKVIDFGIAKATGQQLTDKTLYTGFTQLIGTPLYMSPEQAALSGVDVDTRSDVYSLGVLLYELLTGTTPFSKETLSKVGYDELRRIIREEEPPRPSMRLSTLQAQAASTIATGSRINARQLSRQLRGELDWIVMQALEKDRNRRYESASALAADIERYLRDEPVQACPPSTAYRICKYARRNRSSLIVGAVVLASLALVPLTLAVNSGKRAAMQRRVAGQVQQSLAEARSAIDAGDLVQARQRVIESRAAIGMFRRELTGLSDDVDKLTAELDERNFDRERFDQFRRLSLEAQSRMGFAQGGRGSNGGAGRRVANHATFMDIHTHYNRLGFSQWNNGDRMAREALELFHVLTDPHWVKKLSESWLTPPQKRQVQEAAYETLVSLALYAVRAFPPSGKDDLQEGLALLDRAQSFHNSTRAFWFVRMELHGALGDMPASLEAKGQFQAAKAWTALDHYLPGKLDRWDFDFAKAIAPYEAVLQLQPDHYNSLFSLADSLAMTRRPAEAVQAFTGCIALRANSLHAYLCRADCYEILGRNDSAKADYDAAVAVAPNDIERAYALRFRQDFFARTGKIANAQADHEQAVAIRKRLAAASRTEFGPDHENTIKLDQLLGVQYGSGGEHERSIRCLEEVYQRQLAAAEFKDHLPLNDLMNLSDAYREARLFDKEQALVATWFEGNLAEPNGVLVRGIKGRWGQILVERGRYEDAERLLRDVIGNYERPPNSNRYVGGSLSGNIGGRFASLGSLGEALLGQGKLEEAEQWLLESYEMFKEREFEGQRREVSVELMASAIERLVRLYEAMNQPEKAKLWRERANGTASAGTVRNHGEESKISPRSVPQPNN